MREPNELAAALRACESRSKRKMLDEAAELLELMAAVMRRWGECELCAHVGEHEEECDRYDLSCRECPADCRCKVCRDMSEFEFSAEMAKRWIL